MYYNGTSSLDPNVGTLSPHPTAFSFGNWQRLEFIYKSSSSAGVDDGSMVVRVNGTTLYNNTDAITFAEGNLGWRYVAIGQGVASITSGVLSLGEYVDELYIDRSWARIEIGNNAVYADCTHREIQPALTWSDTGITGTFNRGSFNSGDTVYFFVIDEDGVASDGYPVTIGGLPNTPSSITNTSVMSGVLFK